MLYKLLTNEKRWFIIYHAFGDMAQLVERYVRNVQATSSNLVISTTLSDEKGAFCTLLFLFKVFSLFNIETSREYRFSSCLRDFYFIIP